LFSTWGCWGFCLSAKTTIPWVGAMPRLLLIPSQWHLRGSATPLPPCLVKQTQLDRHRSLDTWCMQVLNTEVGAHAYFNFFERRAHVYFILLV
jgi:hypothetical protein